MNEPELKAVGVISQSNLDLFAKLRVVDAGVVLNLLYTWEQNLLSRQATRIRLRTVRKRIISKGRTRNDAMLEYWRFYFSLAIRKGIYPNNNNTYCNVFV